MKSRTFKILSLSGGGFRGLYTAVVLAKLEERAKMPLARCFDLICGTSFGGILAMALGLEKPMCEMVSEIEENGSKVFRKNSFVGRRYFKAIYRNDGFRNVLERIFGDCLFGDSKHSLLITTYNYSSGRPSFFKSSAGHEHDRKLKMVEIAMATSAAPVFFPAHKSASSGFVYLDGGVVGNAPGLFGLHEAQFFLKKPIDEIRLLSIGTMSRPFRRDAKESLDKGALRWGEKLFSTFISSQEQITHGVLSRVLGEHYNFIDENPSVEQAKYIGLDKHGEEAVEILKSAASQSAIDFLGKAGSQVFFESPENHTHKDD